jgi:hypothetical protein
MIKYMTGGWQTKIEKVEIERETGSSVWVGGRRHEKRTNWHIYHNTWDEARTYLLAMATHKVRSCQSSLDSAKAELSKISKLKK